MQEKKQNKKPQWDGRTRPSNDLYKKNYDEIFKEKSLSELLREGFEEEKAQEDDQ